MPTDHENIAVDRQKWNILICEYTEYTKEKCMLSLKSSKYSVQCALGFRYIGQCIFSHLFFVKTFPDLRVVFGRLCISFFVV